MFPFPSKVKLYELTAKVAVTVRFEEISESVRVLEFFPSLHPTNW